MKSSAASIGGKAHSSPILLLLLLSLVLVGLLAAQAYNAARSHSAMAEKVLRGYAALAAEEYAQRAANEIGFNGYYYVITALKEKAGSPTGSLPSPEDLAAHAVDETKRGYLLARSVFRFDPAAARLETAGGDLELDAAAWLRRELGQRGGKPLEPGRRYETRYALVGGKLNGFVLVPMPTQPGGVLSLVGFVVDTGALASALRRAFDRGPLLPASLGGSELTKDVVALELADPFGGLLVRAGGPISPASLVSVRTLGFEPNGILLGFVVRAALDPSVAPRLAIGGLPRSRLPVLLGLLGLTAGLMMTAMIQLRRERALSRLRSDFVSRVSHELRTPLTQIRMFAETLLLDRVRNEGERIESLAIIDREARRLSNLVENVLRFSRGQRGDLRLAPRAQDLAPIVRDLLDEFRPLAEGRGTILTAKIPDGAIGSVDEDALRQILLNLLDNAVKYGPEGQEVRVGVTSDSTVVRISVDDEGPGIPQAEQARIWQPFYRLQVHSESPVAGTGIGLSVVADLVALQSGRFWVERGERDGARFVVELPAANGVEERA